MITDPLRNRYFLGFGMGLIIGGSFDSQGINWWIVGPGFLFTLAGVALSFFEKKKALTDDDK